ncbi:MAG TPA: peptide chain release factor 1 [Candidatus Limnocylindrales bacterium]|nr:peptide chain release factor 1 [Candidatus Limnocylindrales bacterium]
MDGLEAKLAAIARQYDDLQTELARPEVTADPDALRRLGRELAQLQPVVAAYRGLADVREQLTGARQLRDSEQDPAMRELARSEVDSLEADEARLLEDLRLLLLPRDPNDDRDVIVEIRAGAGGEEAALFAGELLRMYLRYADDHRWRSELMSAHETGNGGVKEAIVEIRGDGAYSRLKFEGGVHRVQRVPVTESSGRIHTSTATVVVMPEAEEVDVPPIDEEKDLRIEVKRSSGPGGQSVNTTDSAVRITHLPTGLVVEIQDEKSQHKNKAKALAVLRSRLYERELERRRAEESATRRGMIGAGDRSEKIRTYNFPQNRVTDHRINRDVHDLPRFLQGNLDEMIDALATEDQASRLRDLEDGDGSDDSRNGSGRGS